MPKNNLAWFQRMLAILSPTKKNNNLNGFSRARELYLLNFANRMTMMKNGELEEYIRFNVPKEQELKWACELKELLFEQIYNGQNALYVVNLSRIDLPQSDILDAFSGLTNSPHREQIYTAIKQQQSHFDPEHFEMIVQLFK